MLLTTLKAGLKPLTLATGLVAGAAFMYADIDKYTSVDGVISNNVTSRYIKDIDNAVDNAIIEKSRFNEYYTSWREGTMFLSSVESIINRQDFKAIVSMGMSAVPFIIEELSTQPSNLVWALNMIFKKKITDRNVTVSEACKLWIKAFS
ncbi:MAG: hypothetical protein Q4E49_05835 [Bacteroidales bacterium]|nr:hypothetical protein [Bacteroidales bacterium]